MKDKMFKCFSLNLFRYLVANGFVPIIQRRNMRNEDLFMWLFNNTEELKECVNNYKNK